MLHTLSSVDWTAVSAIATALATIVVIFSAIIALRSLRTIGRTNELEAVNQFFEFLRSSEDDRRFILQDVDLLDPATKLDLNAIRRVKDVINFLNKTGMLMDMGLLPQKFVLSLIHTVIIRCCFLVIPFAAAEESRIGGRYGRRLKSLVLQAQMYHDASPNHRITKIRIQKKGLRNGEVIYETQIRTGIEGVWQRLVWRYQRMRRKYTPPRDVIPEGFGSHLVKLWRKAYDRVQRVATRSSNDAHQPPLAVRTKSTGQ